MVEIYRSFNDNVEVSNLGNVRYNGVQLEEHIGNPYNYVNFDGEQHRVHILVGQVFSDVCGECKKYYHYHHLNRNQKDNRADNIVCLSPSEHKRLHQKEDGASIAVQAFDKNGNKVGVWDSMWEAGEKTGTCYRHINNIINGRERRFTAGGYYWFKAELGFDEVQKKILEIKNSKYQGLIGNNNRNLKKNSVF